MLCPVRWADPDTISLPGLLLSIIVNRQAPGDNLHQDKYKWLACRFTTEHKMGKAAQ